MESVASNPNITNIVEYISSGRTKNFCAPMVRYSTLPFRLLVRKYGCNVAYTPMIIAESFLKSKEARKVYFETNQDDRPLVFQFAAHDPHIFAAASELVYNYCDGVDLNCGCPQKWAKEEGYGACLLSKPECVSDIIKQTRNRIPSSNFSLSSKIRIKHNTKETINFVQQMEMAGISFIAIHGRTVEQRNETPNLQVLKEIVQSTSIPVIGNGGINSYEDMKNMLERTGCHGINFLKLGYYKMAIIGVMAARGLLHNPALFSGASNTPVNCIWDWWNLGVKYQPNFFNFRNQLGFMCHGIFKASTRLALSSIKYDWNELSEFLHLNIDIPA